MNRQHAWIADQISSHRLRGFESGQGPYDADTKRGFVEPRAHEIAHWICLGEPARRRSGSISINNILNGSTPRRANQQEAMSIVLELDALAALGMPVSESRLVAWASSDLRTFDSSMGDTCHYKRWLRREMRRARETKAHARRVRRFVNIIERGAL